MRTLLFVLLAISSCATLYAQDDFEKPGPIKGSGEWYRQRSRNQLLSGSLLTGAGIILLAIGAEQATSSLDFSGHGSDSKGVALVVLGAISTVVGAPILVSSFINRHKARLLLGRQTAWLPGQRLSFPAITLSLPLRRAR